MISIQDAPAWGNFTHIVARTDHYRQMICMDDQEAEGYEFGIAEKGKDYFHALKLVQDIYKEEGYVNPENDTGPCRLLKNHYYDKTAVFVGKKGDEIAFTVSLFPDSPWGLPMDDIYKKELDQLRSKGRKIGEVGCLATHPDHRNGSQNILMHGNKLILKYALEEFDLDDLVITIHPKHAEVYKQTLMFEDLNPGTVKTYPTVNHNPAVALRLNLDGIQEKVRQFYGHHVSAANLYHFLFEKESNNIEAIEPIKATSAMFNMNHPTTCVV